MRRAVGAGKWRRMLVWLPVTEWVSDVCLSCRSSAYLPDDNAASAAAAAAAAKIQRMIRSMTSLLHLCMQAPTQDACLSIYQTPARPPHKPTHPASLACRRPSSPARTIALGRSARRKTAAWRSKNGDDDGSAECGRDGCCTETGKWLLIFHVRLAYLPLTTINGPYITLRITFISTILCS